VPTTNWTVRADGETGVDAAPFAADWRPAGTIVHVFTHFELRLDVFRADVTLPPAGDGWWARPGDLPGEALPSVMRKAIAAALPEVFKPTSKPRGSSR
jgi:A/G-specific adenine glycosylase